MSGEAVRTTGGLLTLGGGALAYQLPSIRFLPPFTGVSIFVGYVIGALLIAFGWAGVGMLSDDAACVSLTEG